MSISIANGRRNFPAWYIWLSGLIVAGSLMLLGYSQTFPVLYSSQEFPVLKAISPLFWIGLIGCFICLAGWVHATENGIAHYLATMLFVFFSSMPQLLYIDWGSDAGVLGSMVEYAINTNKFDLSRDTQTISYFQWPANIFFDRLLTDLLSVDVFTASRIGFILTIFCVSSGIFLFWQWFSKQQSFKTRGAFWGTVIYFTSLYWFHNWQSAPYTFSLAFFIPALALLDRRDIRYRIVLYLFIIVGMESHALFGIWLFMILAVYFVIELIRKKSLPSSLSVILFVFVAQVTLIVYKNTKFLHSMFITFRGYYNALLDTQASDRAIAIQAHGALETTPLDLAGRILKTLSFFDMGIVLFIILITAFYILRKRIFRYREISLAVAGTMYFILGIFYAAIGTRSLQLIAFLPVSFVVDALVFGSKKFRKMLLILCFLALLLFPMMIMRSHQSSENYVKAEDIFIKNFLNQHFGTMGENTMILTEGVRPINPVYSWRLIRPYQIEIERGCQKDFLIMDTAGLRAESDNLIQEIQSQKNGHIQTTNGFEQRLYQLNDSLVYSNGISSIQAASDCRNLQWLYYLEK